MKMKLKRVYHRYELWEEIKCGMWRDVTGEERKHLKNKAIELMKNPERFKNAMMKAINKWKYSCEHHLSATNMNRQAWLGHAGCCIEMGLPEDITREAWHCIDKEQQIEADRVAAEVISEWEKRYAKT